MEGEDVRPREGRASNEDLKEFFIQFDVESALRTITMASHWLTIQRKQFDIEFGVPATSWALAYLAKLTLFHSKCKRGGTRFQIDDLRKALELYEGLPEPIEFTTPKLDPIAPERTFLRLANLQFPFMENSFLSVARMAILLMETSLRTKRGPSIDVNARLAEIHGMTTESIIRTGVLVCAAAERSKPFAPVMSLESLSRSDIPSVQAELQLDNLLKFAGEFGNTVEGFRSGYQDRNFDSPYTKYAFNELQSHPLISFGDNMVCLPCHPYLLQRISTGLYFSLSDSTNLGGKSNSFREKFGFIFEEYVGEQLRAHVRGFDICPEFFFDSGRRSPDWILVKGSDAVLIECKSSQLSVGAKMYFDDKFLEIEGSRLYTRGVQQVARFVEYVEKNPSEIAELAGVNRFFGLVVTYVPLYLANGLYSSLFGAQTGPLPATLSDIQFLSISELEDLLGLTDRYDLIGILARRAAMTESPSEFRQFMRDEIGTSRDNALLTRKAEELFGWTAPRRSWLVARK